MRLTQNKGLAGLQNSAARALSLLFHGKFFRCSQATENLSTEEPFRAARELQPWESAHFCSRSILCLDVFEASNHFRNDLAEHTAIKSKKERGTMKNQLKTLATLALVSALSAGVAQTTASSTKTTKPKRPVARRAVPRKPSVESQIQSLRDDMQTQIQQLKQQLSDRDQQLQQAQQAAAAAQAAATQAQQQASQQSAAMTENTSAVSNLQGAVNDLKTNNLSLASTVQSEQEKVQKQMTSPDEIYFKGITLSPSGSFLAAETVYRDHATGSGLNTPFNAIPLNGSAQAQYSEFEGSGRQSRVAMYATGKVNPDLTLHGYYEADWLSAGVTSNNNESNSYTMRQRQLWAQAHWGSLTFTGGQMWSLATETTKLTQNKSEILPSTIDPQYTAGFVWERQYGFRVSKDFGKTLSLAASAENAQIPSVSGHGLPTNFIIGQAGTGGGLYNSTANYASSVAPDFVAKLAYEPSWGGHYELFGVGRFFRARVYPNATATTPSAAGAYNDTTTGGGVGGSMRVPTLGKRLDVGLKGIWGDGIGRYGSSQIADTTVHPDGQLALIHGFSALGTLELKATKRLSVYANYGGDYAGRRYFLTSPTKSVGYGSYLNVETGCGTEPPPPTTNSGYTPGTQTNCTADTKDVQEFTAGYWYNFYDGPKGRLRQGIQYAYFQRNIWSGIGTTPQASSNMFWTSFRYYLP
jgi:hypothetical protein